MICTGCFYLPGSEPLLGASMANRDKFNQSDETKEVDRLIMEEEIPTPQERQKMDKEFKIWRTVVICAVVIAAAAYVIPFIVV